MTRPTSRRLATAASLAAVLVLSGCGVELTDIPMPKTVEGETYTVSAVFDSALNLPVGAPVRLAGDRVGEVVEVEAEDYTAVVTFELSERVDVPRRTKAAIRTASPMGEAFVEITPGRGGPRLAEGDVIGRKGTETAPDVVDLLSALSVITTGGSFADIEVIVTELNQALQGNTGTVRALIEQLDRSLTSLNDHTGEIDRVLNGLDRLGGQLAADSEVVVRGLRELRPAIRALAGQRERLMTLLGKVVALGRTTTRVVRATQDELVADLHAADRVLGAMVAEQDALRPTMLGVQKFAHRLDRETPSDFALFDLRFITELGVNGLPIVDGVGDGEDLGIDSPEWPWMPDLPDIRTPVPGVPELILPPEGPGSTGSAPGPGQRTGPPSLESLLSGAAR